MVNYTGYDFGAVTTTPDEGKAKELVLRLLSWDQYPHINLFPKDVINMMIEGGMISKESVETLMKGTSYTFPTLPFPHV